MAKVYLDSGDTFTLSGAASVYGSSGTEKLIVNSGATGVVVDQTVERVDLAGASSAYTFQQSGNQLKVFSGTTVVATIPLQDDTDGTQVVFSNGSVSAKVGATGMTLGGAAVTSTAAAVTPTTIDATVTSGSGSTGGSTTGQTFSLTTTAGEVKALTAGNDTVDASSTTNTLNGDTVVDTSTTDSDTLNAVFDAAAPAASTVSGIENFNITGKFTAVTFDAANVSNSKISATGTLGGSVVLKNIDGSKGVSATVNTGTAAAPAEFVDLIKNATVTIGGTAVTGLKLDTDATGTEAVNAVTVNLAGGTLAAVGGAQLFKAVTLNSKNAANTVNIDGATSLLAAATDKITATGDQSLTVILKDTQFTGGTFVDSTTAGTTTVRFDGATTLDSAVNVTKIAADVIEIGDAGKAGNTTITAATGQTLKVIDGGANASVSLIVEAAATGATANLQFTAGADQAKGLTAKTNISTVNLSGAAANTAGSTDTQVVITADTGAVDFGTATVNLSGATDLSFVDAGAGATIKATKIVGTNLTGKLSYEFSGDTGNVANVIGGSGDDTFIFNASQAATIDGGLGSDTLKFAATTDLSSKAVSLTSIENVNINAATVTFAAGQVTGKSLVTYGGDFTVNQMDGVSMDLTNISGDVTKKISIGVDAAVQGVAQTITGSATLINNISVNGLTAKGTITTGSAKDTVSGGTKGDVIVLGAGDDTVNGKAGGDTLTGGDGNDTFTLDTGNGSAAGAAAGTFSGYDQITDFKAGAGAYDKLDLTFPKADFSSITTAKTTMVNTKGYIVANNPTIGGTAVTALTASDFTNVDKVATFLNAVAATTGTNTNTFTIIVNDATNNTAAIYDIAEGDSAATIVATEIKLLGTVTLTNGAIAATDIA